MASIHRPAPFRLLRWFAVLSAVIIALGASALAWVISSFLTEQMFRREATLSSEFVHNVLVSDGSIEFLKLPQDERLRALFRNSIDHLTNMREVMRTNVYGADRSVLWSTDAELIGQRFTDNHELDEAMRGELVVEAGRITADVRFKREHAGLSKFADFFVETYIPVTEGKGRPVIGVVELYKAPLALTEAIHEGQRRVAIAACAGALVLYLSLFGLVRRADRIMHRQHERLREAETLAVIGEMASSVAHNIRNPLASIRSSAELSLDSDDAQASESSKDIVREVDRISARVTELLQMSQHAPTENQRVDLVPLLDSCIKDHAQTFGRQHQELSFDRKEVQASVEGDPHLIKQVFHSILANASEAMEPGRHCAVTLRGEPRQWVVQVQDEGAGMGADTMAQVFRPFFTTKPRGLGLGLPLARRIVERMEGQLFLESQPGRGTTVTVRLRKA